MIRCQMDGGLPSSPACPTCRLMIRSEGWPLFKHIKSKIKQLKSPRHGRQHCSQGGARKSFSPTRIILALVVLISVTLLSTLCLGSNDSERKLVKTLASAMSRAANSRSSELSLEYLGLSSVPSEQFCLQPSWQQVNSLSLAYNQIAQINSSAFSCIGLRLRILNLRRNKIQLISPDAFKQLNQLQVLLLDGNRLKQIPSESLNWLADSLRHLNLANNQIQSIGSDEVEDPQSRNGSVVSSRLKTIELISLNLKGNPLARLEPQAFKHLSKLRTLILTETSLNSSLHPPALASSQPLSNDSSSRPGPFVGLDQLRFLHLDRSSGNLSSLETSEAICRHSPRLASFILRSNGLVKVPQFSNCQTLLLLDLAHNRLAGHLDSGPWRSQTRLLDLYLGHNQIESLGERAFEGLASLQVLELDHNRLTVIHLQAFVAVSRSLIELNLAHNQRLAELPSRGLERLRSFKSYGNYQLRHLPHLAGAKLLALTFAYHCCDYCSDNNIGAPPSEPPQAGTPPPAPPTASLVGLDAEPEPSGPAPNGGQADNQMATSGGVRFVALVSGIWRQMRKLISRDAANPADQLLDNNNGADTNTNSIKLPDDHDHNDDDDDDELEARRSRSRAIDLANLTELVIWAPSERARPPRSAPNWPSLAPSSVPSAGSLIDGRQVLNPPAEISWRLGSLVDLEDADLGALLASKPKFAGLARFRRMAMPGSAGGAEQLDHDDDDQQQPPGAGELVIFAPTDGQPSGRPLGANNNEEENANPRAQQNTVLCWPQPNSFMPCQDLFDSWWLRAGIWLVFGSAFLGNISVIIVLTSVRSSSSSSALTSIMWLAHSRRHIDVPRFLVINLAIADLLMALYLGLLACIDLATLGEFKFFAIKWQYSAGCQLAGFLAVLSSELSVFILAIITLERNYAITNAVHLNRRLSLQKAMLIMLLGYSFALVMAGLPLNGISDYRKSSICLPLDAESNPASRYYVITLISINTFSFVLLFSCYLRMYCAIRGSQAWNTNDLRIAKRMSILVVTDFLCWMPIISLACAALFGHKHEQLISPRALKLLTIFILPLNSVANPFLYAITTKKFKRDLATLKHRLAGWLWALVGLLCWPKWCCNLGPGKGQRNHCTDRNCINHKQPYELKYQRHGRATSCNIARHNLKAATKLMIQEQNFRKNLLANNESSRKRARPGQKLAQTTGPPERQVILVKADGPMIGLKLIDDGHGLRKTGKGVSNTNNNIDSSATVSRLAGKYLNKADASAAQQRLQAEQRLLVSNYHALGGQTNNMVTMNRTSMDGNADGDDYEACDPHGVADIVYRDRPALCTCQRSLAARLPAELGDNTGASIQVASHRQVAIQVHLDERAETALDDNVRGSGRIQQQQQPRPKIVLDLGSTDDARPAADEPDDLVAKDSGGQPSESCMSSQQQLLAHAIQTSKSSPTPIQLLVSSMAPHGQSDTLLQLVGDDNNNNDNCMAAAGSRCPANRSARREHHQDGSSTSSIIMGQQARGQQLPPASATCHRLASCQAILVPSGSLNGPDATSLGTADGPRSASACAYHWPTPTLASPSDASRNWTQARAKCSSGQHLAVLEDGFRQMNGGRRGICHKRQAASNQSGTLGAKAGNTSSWRSINRLIISPVAKTWSSIQISLQSTIVGGSSGLGQSAALNEDDNVTSMRPPSQASSRPTCNNKEAKSNQSNAQPKTRPSTGLGSTSTNDFEEEEDILKLSSPARRRLLRNSERRMSRSCDLTATDHHGADRFESLLIDANGEIVLKDADDDHFNQLSGQFEASSEANQDRFDDKRILLATIQRLAASQSGQSRRPDPANRANFDANNNNNNVITRLPRRRGRCTRCRSWSPALLDKLEDCMYQIRSKIPNFNFQRQQMYQETTLEHSGEDASLSENQQKVQGPAETRELVKEDVEFSDRWSSKIAYEDKSFESAKQQPELGPTHLMLSSSSSSSHLSNLDDDASNEDEFHEFGLNGCHEDHADHKLGSQKARKRLTYNPTRQSRSRLRQQSSTTSDTLSNRTSRTILTNVSSFDSQTSIPATQSIRLVSNDDVPMRIGQDEVIMEVTINECDENLMQQQANTREETM